MRISIAAVAAAIAIFAGAADAATVSISPATQTQAPGSPITLDLNVSGLGDGTALGAFDISVNYDSAVLRFDSASFGDPVRGDQLDLANLGFNGPVAIGGTGTVDLIETDIFDSPSTLLDSQAHDFTLAALSFYAIASGTTPMTLTLNGLADQIGNPLSAAVQDTSLTVQASPAPLPAAAWLLASGLAALAAPALRRRRRSAAEAPA